MNRNDIRAVLLDIDRVEADLVSLQARLWSVRQRLQTRFNCEVGFQYDGVTPNAVPRRQEVAVADEDAR